MIDQLKQTLKKFRQEIDKKNPLAINTFSVLTTGDDLNTLFKQGVYGVDTKVLHIPEENEYGTVLVLNNSNLRVYQIFLSSETIVLGKLYYRLIRNDPNRLEIGNWQRIQATEVQAVSSDEELSDETEVV